MIIKRLFIENLRSFERQEIIFPKGSTLLSGDIGAGKTTVLLAIEFALFGLQPSQRGSSLLRSGQDFGRAVLEFEIEGKNIIIERSLKRGKKSVSQDLASITIDREVFEGAVTEIKSRVLKILNYPGEFSKKTNLLYKFTVYTPQEEMKQIILEPGELRLNTLRHVFGIDKYKRIEDNVSIFASKLREKIRLSEGMLYDLEEDKEKLKKLEKNLILLKEKQEQAISDYRNSVEVKEEKIKLLNEMQEKIDEKKQLENEKSKSEVLIQEKRQQILSLENSIKSLVTQIEEAKRISFDKNKLGSIDERIVFQKNKLEELQKDYIQIISNIKSKESKRREVEALKNKISLLDKCPTCLQEVSIEYKKNILDKINEEMEEIQKKINESAIKKNELIEKIDVVKKTQDSLLNEKSELELLKIKLENLKEKENRIIEIENQKGSVKKDLEMLEKHIKSIQDSVKNYDTYEIIFKERGGDVEIAKKKENELAIKKAESNKEIQFCEQQIKETKDKISKKESLRKKTERLREIEYWTSEKFLNLILFTEKQVMIKLKEEFSRLFSKWFSVLVSDELAAKLDDNFSPVIEQQDYELDYSFLSGGERTAIALAYRLSLNQVLNSLLSKIKTRNLVILDEPTDGFSAQQLDKMRDVLSQLNTEQLIIVSHEQKIESFVDNIIRFRKELGVTRIDRKNLF